MHAKPSPCPTHPNDEGGPCEPLPSEPGRCVYGEHALGGGPWPLAEAAIDFFLNRLRQGRPLDQGERDLIVRESNTARARAQRLSAAARAGLFFFRNRTWGRAELEQWQTLTRAAGCPAEEVVPPTDAGLVRVLEVALRVPPC